MQAAVAKGVRAGDPLSQSSDFLIDARIGETVHSLAIKQHHRILRRRGAESRGYAVGAVEFHDFQAVGIVHQDARAVHLGFDGAVRCGKGCGLFACRPCADDPGDRAPVPIPARARQAAEMAHRLEFAAALRPDLHAVGLAVTQVMIMLKYPTSLEFLPKRGDIYALEDRVLISFYIRAENGFGNMVTREVLCSVDSTCTCQLK